MCLSVEGQFKKTVKGCPQGGLCKALHKDPYAKKVVMQRKLLCKESCYAKKVVMQRKLLCKVTCRNADKTLYKQRITLHNVL